MFTLCEHIESRLAPRLRSFRKGFTSTLAAENPHDFVIPIFNLEKRSDAAFISAPSHVQLSVFIWPILLPKIRRTVHRNVDTGARYSTRPAGSMAHASVHLSIARELLAAYSCNTAPQEPSEKVCNHSGETQCCRGSDQNPAAQRWGLFGLSHHKTALGRERGRCAGADNPRGSRTRVSGP